MSGRRCVRGKNAGSCQGCRRELRNKFEFFAAAAEVEVAAEMVAEVKILEMLRQLPAPGPRHNQITCR